MFTEPLPPHKKTQLNSFLNALYLMLCEAGPSFIMQHFCPCEEKKGHINYL